LHCLDRRTGKPHWTCDLLAACWCTPLLVDGKLLVPDEDGDVAILRPFADPKRAGLKSHVDKQGRTLYFPNLEINLEESAYCTPVAANGKLFFANRAHLFAIESLAKP